MKRRRLFSPGASLPLADAGRQLWLAGLGALSQVDRGGRDFFDGLVERGKQVEKNQLRAVDRAVARSAESAERLGGGLRRSVHAGVDEVLHRANLPSRADLRELAARLDRLSERVEAVAARRRR